MPLLRMIRALLLTAMLVGIADVLIASAFGVYHGRHQAIVSCTLFLVGGSYVILSAANGLAIGWTVTRYGHRLEKAQGAYWFTILVYVMAGGLALFVGSLKLLALAGH